MLVFVLVSDAAADQNPARTCTTVYTAEEINLALVAGGDNRFCVSSEVDESMCAPYATVPPPDTAIPRNCV